MGHIDIPLILKIKKIKILEEIRIFNGYKSVDVHRTPFEFRSQIHYINFNMRDQSRNRFLQPFRSWSGLVRESLACTVQNRSKLEGYNVAVPTTYCVRYDHFRGSDLATAYALV